MKRLLNTLYVTTPDAYLSKDGTNVVISSQQKILFRMPIQNIQSIITFGYQGASPGLMRLCSENGVALSFSRLPDGLWRECRVRRRAIYFFADRSFRMPVTRIIAVVWLHLLFSRRYTMRE